MRATFHRSYDEYRNFHQKLMVMSVHSILFQGEQIILVLQCIQVFICSFSMGGVYVYKAYEQDFHGSLYFGDLYKYNASQNTIILFQIKISISLQFVSVQFSFPFFNFFMLWREEETEILLLSDFASVSMVANDIHVFSSQRIIKHVLCK